jgi:hypothetical protein
MSDTPWFAPKMGIFLLCGKEHLLAYSGYYAPENMGNLEKFCFLSNEQRQIKTKLILATTLLSSPVVQ